MSFRADLHCHTIYSDGTDEPAAVIALASQLNLQGLSITDHDTIDAYKQVVKSDIPLLPGVEISAVFQGEAIHVLGYAFSPKNPDIHALLALQKQKRVERNFRIFEKLNTLGIAITESDMHVHQIGRPHIANYLIEQGLVGSIQEAFDRYLGEGKMAYDPGNRLEVSEVINAIHAAKGKAILAHPHLIKRKRILKNLLDLPFDGIECYYAKLFSTEEKPFVAIAEKKGWLATGGSDYHGSTKPQIPLGCSWVGQQTFEALYEHFLKNT